MKYPIAVFAMLCIVSLTLFACSGQDQSSTTSTQAAGFSSTTSNVATKQHKNISPPVQPILIQNTLAATVVSFYQALEKKDYNKAYTYVSSNAILTVGSSSQKLTQAIFVQKAQDADKVSGSITSFDFIANATNRNSVVATVIRVTSIHSRTIKANYNSHLLFQQENGMWKLVQIDII